MEKNALKHYISAKKAEIFSERKQKCPEGRKNCENVVIGMNILASRRGVCMDNSSSMRVVHMDSLGSMRGVCMETFPKIGVLILVEP